MNWTAQAPPNDPESVISAFQENYTALTDRIGGLSESGWQNKVTLLIDGQLYREAPVGEFLCRCA